MQQLGTTLPLPLALSPEWCVVSALCVMALRKVQAYLVLWALLSSPGRKIHSNVTRTERLTGNSSVVGACTLHG